MILYEDNHLLAVYKPAGILVQGDKTGDDTILDYYKDYIKTTYDKPGAVYLHAAHRLDRPVSGCLILCKTSKSLTRVTTAFREGKVKKMYHALAGMRSTQPEGLITHHLRKDNTKNKTSVVKNTTKGGKKAQLRFSMSGAWRDRCLYRVHPLTGRSHQIRVQLSTIGSPIIGDRKYGGVPIDDPSFIYLHCTAMALEHPVKKEPVFISLPPAKEELWIEARDFIMKDLREMQSQILG